MFVHETHSFYVIAKLGSCKNAPAGYLEKKEAIFSKVLSNVGVEKAYDFDFKRYSLLRYAVVFFKKSASVLLKKDE